MSSENHSNTEFKAKRDQDSVAVAPRDTMVSTAVHFLQNPQVKDSPMSQKRAFLLKKGLTNEEVDMAFDRANSVSQKQQSVHSSVHSSGNDTYGAPPSHLVPSFWSRFSGISSTVVILGVACYGLFQIYKLYIKKMFAQSKRKEDRLSQMELQLVELNRSLSQLRRSLSAVETTVTAQKSQLGKLCDHESLVNLELLPTPVVLNDIKSEIASIKSLLLNRSQFPAAPSIPTIPSWQLPISATKEKSTDKAIESINEPEGMEKINDASLNSDIPNGAESCGMTTTVIDSDTHDKVSPANTPEEEN